MQIVSVNSKLNETLFTGICKDVHLCKLVPTDTIFEKIISFWINHFLDLDQHVLLFNPTVCCCSGSNWRSHSYRTISCITCTCQCPSYSQCGYFILGILCHVLGAVLSGFVVPLLAPCQFFVASSQLFCFPSPLPHFLGWPSAFPQSFHAPLGRRLPHFFLPSLLSNPPRGRAVERPLAGVFAGTFFCLPIVSVDYFFCLITPAGFFFFFRISLSFGLIINKLFFLLKPASVSMLGSWQNDLDKIDTAGSDSVRHRGHPARSYLGQHEARLTNTRREIEFLDNQVAELTTHIQELQREAAQGGPVLPTPRHEPEPRCNIPPPYDGDPKTCRAFLSQCSVVFALQPRTYAGEESKVAFVLMLLTGKARDSGTSVWETQAPCCASFDDFHQEMVRLFDSDSPDPHTWGGWVEDSFQHTHRTLWVPGPTVWSDQCPSCLPGPG